MPRRASGVADGRGCSNGRGLHGAARGGWRASAPVRRLTLDRHDAERKQLRREGEAEQAVEAWGREGERQGKQRAADARLVPR